MRAIPVVLLSILALSACSTSEPPSTLTAPTAFPPSSTEQPTGEAAPIPDSTSTEPPKIRVSAEVMEFMGEYMTLAEESIRSIEALETRRASSGPGCDLCTAGIDVAQSIIDSGLSVMGGEIAWSGEVLEERQGVVLVAVSREIGELKLLNPQGEVVQTSPPTGAIDEVYQLAQQEDGSWLVLSIRQLP